MATSCIFWLQPDLECLSMQNRAVAVTLLGTVLLLIGLLGCSRAGKESSEERQAAILSVAAAADLRFALDDIVAGFQGEHSDIQVRVTYGSSGSFFAQLSNNAPFDLFFSADMDYPRRLIDKGLASRESAFVYAVGHLVLWVPRDSPLDVEKLGMQVLLSPSVRKIAIANPRHAPYGRAAEAALKTAGLYDRVQDRLVYGENVAQTAQFVQTGSADVGLIALSLALAPTMHAGGHYWEIPADGYPRLEQGGVILSRTGNVAAAQALRAYVLGERGKTILRRYGFFLPEK
jgi:molybdate transport system substrate-binding protein